MSMADSKKNSERAAYMKKHNITRTTSNCPMCHKTVSTKRLIDHINNCR